MINKMTTNYKQLFNSVVNAEAEQKSKQAKLVADVIADLVELEAILNDVIAGAGYEHTSVEYIEADKVLCFECHTSDDCLELVLNESTMENNVMRVRNKTIHHQEQTGMDVEYDNEQSIYVSKNNDGNIVYDFGADERDKAGLFTYVVERAAGIVASGNR